jgi:transposase-like protein
MDCRKNFSIRIGTIFEASHIPLHKWLYAMYLIVTSRKGISSMQLSKEIGITQRSAWFLVQRIRAACGNDDVKKILSGIVEVDEAYFGGIEKNKHESKKLKQGRGTVGKTAVIGLRERDGNVVAKMIIATDKLTIQDIIKNHVQNTSVVCTDDFSAYEGLDSIYNHKTVNHSAKQYVDGMAHTNGIESVWSVLKRGFYGTFHKFSVKHLPLYIDEFAFRFNEAKCG